MAVEVFPTGFSDLGTTASLTSVVYADNGTNNGYLSITQMLALGGVSFDGTYTVLSATPPVGDNTNRSATTSFVTAGFAALDTGTGKVKASQLPAGAAVFGASGTSHSTGLVPDPGPTAGTTRFLREDSSWATLSSSGTGTGSTPSSLSLSYGTTTYTGVSEIVLSSGLSATGTSTGGSSTVTISASGTAWALDDGTTTVDSVTSLHIVGGEVSSGGAGQGTLTITGAGSSGDGGGSTSLPFLPGIGNFLSSAGVWQRPAASAFTTYTSGVAATLTDVTNGPIKVSASTADKTIVGMAVTPGANFTIEVLFSINGRSDIADALGIVVGDTSSGHGLQLFIGGNASPRSIYLQEITNITTGGTYAAAVANWSPVASPALYTMKFQLTGTNNIGAYVALDPVDPTLGYYPWGSQAVGTGDFIPQINFAGILIVGNSSGIEANLNIWGYRITYP